jgi:hypothetical protein
MSIGQFTIRILAVSAMVCSAAGSALADIRPMPLGGNWQLPSSEWLVAAPGGRPELLAQWGALPPVPPEERQQMRQQMREHWQQMPPEQRDERRREARERWQQMPSDERQRIREEMRERGGYGDGRHRGHGDRR